MCFQYENPRVAYPTISSLTPPPPYRVFISSLGSKFGGPEPPPTISSLKLDIVGVPPPTKGVFPRKSPEVPGNPREIPGNPREVPGSPQKVPENSREFKVDIVGGGVKGGWETKSI